VVGKQRAVVVCFGVDGDGVSAVAAIDVVAGDGGFRVLVVGAPSAFLVA